MNRNEEAMAAETSTSPSDRYRIRKTMQNPTKLELRDPRTGELTGDYLMIRSSLSDEFQTARDISMQEAGEIKDPDVGTRREKIREVKTRLTASLVAGWSFPEKLTEKSAMEFLRDAPQIREQINAIADDTQRFFKAPSNG